MIIIKSKNGVPSIKGRLCSFGSKKTRNIIESFFEVNKEFVLPKKYMVIVTENDFAKIIKKPKPNNWDYSLGQ